MHYFKIAVVSVAALVCSSTAARVHMFENGESSFDASQRCYDEWLRLAAVC